MVLIVTKKQIYKKNGLKRSFYMFACERCARKIYTCYTEDTKMVHTAGQKNRWLVAVFAAVCALRWPSYNESSSLQKRAKFEAK